MTDTQTLASTRELATANTAHRTWSLWVTLDWTPEGRGTDWYPQLDYDHQARTSQHAGRVDETGGA